jgi:ABC-type oligopeptide transport system ATPase subunit
MTAPLLAAENLAKHYAVREGVFLPKETGRVRAVDGVSFVVMPGQTLGLVGESGCGKSTVGRLVLNLVPATSGRVRFEDIDLGTADAATMRALRRRMQIVF